MSATREPAARPLDTRNTAPDTAADGTAGAGADRTRPATGEVPRDATADPALQGEGNYRAAQRHRESVEDFVAAGRVEPAAREAAPDSPAEAQELRDAEKAGQAPARR